VTVKSEGSADGGDVDAGADPLDGGVVVAVAPLPPGLDPDGEGVVSGDGAVLPPPVNPTTSANGTIAARTRIAMRRFRRVMTSAS
jgi:hypothetical protein